MPRTRWGSAPGGLTWHTCSEASNNAIAGFEPFTRDSYSSNLTVDGLRVLCAPHPRAAAAAAVASGSGSLHSDLRDNELKEFAVEEFLAQALQLETLYAAANACALHAHRMIGRRAGSPAATRCTAAHTRAIVSSLRRSRSARGRRRCTPRSPPAPPPNMDRMTANINVYVGSHTDRLFYVQIRYI